MLGKPVNFKSADGSTDFIINDRANFPLLWNQSPYYYIKLENVDGLWGSDVSTEAYPRPNVPGEKSGDAFRRGKGVALSGVIEGRNLAYTQAGARFLKQMFADLSERKLIFQELPDAFTIYLKCRVVQDLNIVETIPENFQNACRWAWVVGLRADMPYTYKVSDNTLYPTWQV